MAYSKVKPPCATIPARRSDVSRDVMQNESRGHRRRRLRDLRRSYGIPSFIDWNTNVTIAPFSKGGAATAAGIWMRKRGPKFATQILGSSNAQPEKKRRSRPISRVLSWTVIHLGATSPLRSSNLPGPDAGRVMRSLFGLAPGGVCRAGLLPGARCALTAPFHPYLIPCGAIGGIFLLHFPSARAAQALPGTLPYGARTFLGIGHDEHDR